MPDFTSLLVLYSDFVQIPSGRHPKNVTLDFIYFESNLFSVIRHSSSMLGLKSQEAEPPHRHGSVPKCVIACHRHLKHPAICAYELKYPSSKGGNNQLHSLAKLCQRQTESQVGKKNKEVNEVVQCHIAMSYCHVDVTS